MVPKIVMWYRLGVGKTREELLASRREYRRRYRMRPEVQAKEAEYASRPKVKAKQRVRYSYSGDGGFSGVLRRQYGITVEDWARMFEAQGGKCALCLRRLLFDRTTHVDHCHVTSAVRGLLCNGCNRTLGFIESRGIPCSRIYAYLRG